MVNPNIFTYATKELSQDAVIAWLCANYNSNDKNRKELAKAFITFLLNLNDEEIAYDAVEVETQVHSIDILVTLKSNNQVVRYLIIEDKIDSEEHGGQISNYVDKIKKNKECDENQISCVYFKTGHLIKSDNYFIRETNPKTAWRKEQCNSEASRVKNTIIKDLNTIYEFFKDREIIINSINSEILNSYWEILEQQFNRYNYNNNESLSGTNPVSVEWLRFFDEFIQNTVKNNNEWSDLVFTPQVYRKEYTEILICHKNTNVEDYYTYPVVSVKSRSFCGANPSFKIEFLNKGKVIDKIKNKFTNKGDDYPDQIFSYKLPESFSKKELNENTPKSNQNISKTWMENLLTVICDEYIKIVKEEGDFFNLG